MTPENGVRLRTAVLISGRGSNMASLVEAAAQPGYPADMALVIANRAEAPGLAVARAHGIQTMVIADSNYGQRADFDRALDKALRAQGVELVALAGFMRILGADLVGRWAGRIVNIHPSLLPLYPGLDTHARALAAGDQQAGCTVHLVTAELDAGPILGQARVPIEAGDDADSLAARVLAAEHALYPEVLADYARQLLAGKRA